MLVCDSTYVCMHVCMYLRYVAIVSQVVEVRQQKLQVRVKKGYESSDACLWSSQWSLVSIYVHTNACVVFFAVQHQRN